jgi:hypothetical protein
MRLADRQADPPKSKAPPRMIFHPIGLESGPVGSTTSPARQGTEPILTPLEDIARHVVQSPGIRKFPPDRVNGETVVHGLPRIVCQVGIIGIIPVAEPAKRVSAFPERSS